MPPGHDRVAAGLAVETAWLEDAVLRLGRITLYVTSLRKYMEIPPDALSAAALRGIIEEFITREGTEYGASEVPLETKVAQVIAQIRRGEVIIDFDPFTETVDIRSR